MGDHYVPQFYLRGFTSNDKMWAHDRVKHHSFATQPKSVANETSMYPDELEKYLTEQVEEPAKPAITKIRSQEPLTEEDRLAIARYMVVLWKRVPKARTRIHGRLPEVSTSVRDDLRQRFDRAAILNPDLAEFAEQKKAEVDQIIDKYLKSPPPDLWHSTVAEKATPRMIGAMLSMHWDFLVLKNGQFLTSDNPVFFFETDGIGRPTSELTLPFSKDVALLGHRGKARGLYTMASGKEMREINRRTATNATRFVYSASDEPWILDFACKNDHPLSRLT